MISTARQCDRCGAQSKFIVLLASGNTLDFCGHHYQKAKAVLPQDSTVTALGPELVSA